MKKIIFCILIILSFSFIFAEDFLGVPFGSSKDFTRKQLKKQNWNYVDELNYFDDELVFTGKTYDGIETVHFNFKNDALNKIEIRCNSDNTATNIANILVKENKLQKAGLDYISADKTVFLFILEDTLFFSTNKY